MPSSTLQRLLTLPSFPLFFSPCSRLFISRWPSILPFPARLLDLTVSTHAHRSDNRRQVAAVPRSDTDCAHTLCRNSISATNAFYTFHPCYPSRYEPSSV